MSVQHEVRIIEIPSYTHSPDIIAAKCSCGWVSDSIGTLAAARKAYDTHDALNVDLAQLAADGWI